MRQKFTTLTRLVTLLLLLIGSTWSMAQDRKTVNGTVLDKDQNPLPGVSYLVKGTNAGGATDANGTFSVSVPSSTSVIVFSSIGYISKEVTVGNASQLSVNLEEDNKTLNEVVVTGFGMTTEARKLAYSVQSVQGNDITRTANANMVNALQGKVAGVMINQGTGGPMSSSRIRIRGNASLSPNTQPLFVVDGVLIRPGTSGADSWGAAQDFGNIMKNINPDNIESMTVLKGSAASSLYGSEALNGVVVVQTKKGRQDKGLGVTYNHTSTFENAYRFLDLQNEYGAGLSPTFATGADGVPEVDRANFPFSYGPKFEGQQVRDLDGRMVEWKANDPLSFFQTGKYINHNLAIEGGNERSSFRASFSTLKNTSIMAAGTELKRNNFNIRGTQKIGKVLNLDVSADYTDNDMVNPIRQGGNYNPVFRFVYNRPRNMDIDYWSKNYLDPIAGGRRRGSSADPYNITEFMFQTFEYRQFRNEKVFRGNVDLTGNITDWLSFLVRGNVQNELYTGNNQNRGDNVNFSGGEYREYSENKTQTRFQGLVTATRQIGDNFNFSLSVGGETNRLIGGRKFDMRTDGGLRVPDVYSLSNSINLLKTESIALTPSKRIDALYAYGDLTFKDALTLSASYRTDWSSTLTYANGSGDYIYSYPSVGLSWIATESLKDLPTWLSFGKVRASLGYTGGDTEAWSTNQTGVYEPKPAYLQADGSQINLAGFRDPNTLPNYGLKNRLAREVEFGADIRFFNNRLGIDATYYNKITKNEILSLNTTTESGVSSRIVNAGRIQNKGVEILLTATPIKKADFEWNTSINFSRNRNKVLELVQGTDTYELNLGFGADIKSVARVGKDYGTIITPYGFAIYESNDANNPANGQKVIGAISGEGGIGYVRNGSYGSKADKELGSVMEKFLASNVNSIRYKNFTATVQADAKIGGLMSSATHQYGSSLGSFAFTLPGRNTELGGVTFTDAEGNVRNDGIIPEGVLANGFQVVVDGAPKDLGGMAYADAVAAGYVKPIPAYAYYMNLTQWSSGIREYSTFENSWVSLREVSVGYNVPASLLGKAKIQSLRVSLVGRNLGYLYRTAKDGINPEGLYSNKAGEFMEYGGLPFSRNLGVSVSVGL
ncbi:MULTISPECIES: SusC/RagA family TonB-linked outer membrane protein [Dyadobacter]|uniref:SusC/RagA family TonB-linked outer membrane protein n=1 Tax=Dyadobacter chenhuakuii TaxID=2909339 RepID=A0A9X1TV65_9BACT|nr:MULTISPECIES: SusC/RagA family TonB-linked outer membrane protein [Dyadobacter]MCF2500078.1 SusC/RagA family TonB-linked outer membrane protein [Dyadobacter chenhuakuii]MCF2520317.1 SusC/RagA family TonB-linked outer membrane protein [Dyadobacter sp. CY351]